MKHIRTFDHAPESVTSARRFAAEALRDTPAEARDTVSLMVSEVATNCIRHAETGFDLTILRTEHEIRVETTDRAAGKPTVRTPEPTDPDGRGLQIIDMFSEAWGVEQVPGDGKTVWFVVSLGAADRRVGAPAQVD